MSYDEAIEMFSRYLHSDCYLDAPPDEAVEIAIEAIRYMQFNTEKAEDDLK